AVGLADLLKTSTMPSPCSPRCVHLPLPVVVASGVYNVQPKEWQALTSNPMLTIGQQASLPVHVTYRALWPPKASSAINDALGAGLPIFPVQAQVTASPSGVPGPAGPGLGFQTDLQSALTYERTIAPDSPYDLDFPPDIDVVRPQQGNVLLQLDKTTQTQPAGVATLPQFELSRADGSLEGWTTYLRDATTKRPISPVKTIGPGPAADGGLLLPTNHHPPPTAAMPDGSTTVDALTNAELVIAPPPAQAQPLPTYVLAPQGGLFRGQQMYPALPPVATVQGTIEWSDAAPVAADLIFEALAIYAAVPTRSANPADAGTSAAADASQSNDGSIVGAAYVPEPNFEFVAHAQPRPNPTSGQSTFQVVLPRGVYRIVVRPEDPSVPDASAGFSHAVTIVDGFDTGDGSSGDANAPMGALRLVVQVAPTINGMATLADDRALSGAVVEALPVGCPVPSGDAGLKPKDTASCMPRGVETLTHSDGSFSISLDPGEYALRVEPPDGTRLPWVWQPLHVSRSQQVSLTIPVPVHHQVELADGVSLLVNGSGGNLIANAIVRVFTIPPQNGSAIEIGRTITDATGRLDLYLDPNPLTMP
ncbi:MAG: hypothetical protein M3O46_11230, partial [Myxococcota bacterium]|nr:hypothetical protein [Myxococcota bacterium]